MLHLTQTQHRSSRRTSYPYYSSTNRKALWENTSKLFFFGRTDDLDAIFFPGGHGPMCDLTSDATSQQLTAEFWEKGKVVAAVCHGSPALVNIKLADGNLLLKGKDSYWVSQLGRGLR
ncbi:class I glutamine amidotransferase-like protein [Hypoxylon sp. NC0597]|nr:class I glutamine amidotransferase-like protein [Hypoxylon sp. NC0597]